MNVARWLSQQPQPVTIRCATPDGERTIQINAKAKRRWGEAARAIDTFEATRIEALDGQGTVLRVCDIELPTHEEERPPVPSSQLQSDVVVIMNHLATHLAHAYEHSTQVAFSHLCEVVNIAFARLDGLERAWTRMLNLQMKTAQGPEEQAEAGEVNLNALLQHFGASFLQGKLAGPQGTPTAATARADDQTSDKPNKGG
jgi:hypothetical protein